MIMSNFDAKTKKLTDAISMFFSCIMSNFLLPLQTRYINKITMKHLLGYNQ